MYKFYINHIDLERPQLLKYDPIGWDSLGRTIRRDLALHGVFWEYTPRLQFIKDGKDLIHRLLELHGPETEVTLTIYRKNRKTRMFDLIYTGRLNLMKARVTKTYIECNVEQTGFQQKLRTRQDIKVNLSATTSQEGKPLSSITTCTVDLPAKVILKRFTRDKEYVNENNSKPTVSFIVNDNQTWYILLSLDSTTLSFDEIEDRYSYGLQASELDPVEALKYVFQVKDEGEYRFSFDMHNLMNITGLGLSGSGTAFEMLLTYGKPGNYTTEVIGAAGSIGAGVNLYEFENEYTVDLVKDDEVYIYYRLTVIDSVGGAQQIIFKEDAVDPPVNLISNITIEAHTVFPASQATFHLMHEAFTRVIESITDRKDSFRSTLYGRTDSSPVTYPADGPGALKGFTNGKRVRGFPSSENPNYASLKDLLAVGKAIDCAGLGVEYQDGKERCIVEHISYFYQPTRVAQIPSVSNLEKVVLEEFYYNEIEGGYDKWGDEAIGGLDEPNARREYTLPISQTKKKLSLKCPYPASTYLMETVRRQHYTVSQTKDTKFDNDNFLLQFKRSGGIVVEYGSDFESVTNVISPETLANVRLSPIRNIIRNGALIRGGLYKKDLGKVVLAFGEGNTAMVSKLPGEAYGLFGLSGPSETSFDIEDLDRALWIPEAYEFVAVVSQEVMDEIQHHPYGYIEFAEDGKNWMRGYILEITQEPDSEQTKFKLLKANI